VARESSIEKKCRLYVESKGGWLKKWVSPGNVGVPDRICCLLGGHVLFFEFKRPGKGLSDIQIEVISEMRTMGCKVYVVDNVLDFKKIIEEKLK